LLLSPLIFFLEEDVNPPTVVAESNPGPSTPPTVDEPPIITQEGEITIIDPFPNGFPETPVTIASNTTEIAEVKKEKPKSSVFMNNKKTKWDKEGSEISIL